MKFKMFTSKGFSWKTEMLAPIREPKVSKEVSGTQMVCGNADHWAKNCHMSCLPPGPCPNCRHYWVDFLTLLGQDWVSFPELLFHRRIIWTFWVKQSRAIQCCAPAGDTMLSYVTARNLLPLPAMIPPWISDVVDN